MVFSSVLFLFIYLPVTLLLYYVSPLRFRNLVLLVLNLIFYGWGEPIYVFLMLASVAMDYFFGLQIQRRRDLERRARLFVVLSVLMNVGILFIFKYLDFAIESLRGIPGLGGMEPLGIALPIGISFYTFQKMSYIIDVYRGDSRAQKSFVSFGTYITLFPQLIAGPIVKYKDIESQLNHREYRGDRFSSGVTIFTVGLAKKVLLANSIGALWDTYGAMDAGQLTTAGAWLGVFAFTFQIYFDFSGYSDMAIGLGRMLGFEFLPNFQYPYISRSITEFWRRWHISLGTWFRDYVYIPLGGNRRGRGRWLLNILIVWAITGIWHGASWNFLFWGLYFAGILMAEKLFLLNWLKKLPAFVSHIYALFLIVVGWGIFAPETGQDCAVLFKALFGFSPAGPASAADFYYFMNYLPLFVILALASLPFWAERYRRWNWRGKGVLTCVLIAAALLLSTAALVDSTYNPFLYFRF